MKSWLTVLLGASVVLPDVTLAADEGWTQKHEAGRCAIRGNCGKQSIFGKELPCPDNGKAEDPDEELRDMIVNVCGSKWQDTPVCCRKEQVEALASNLKTVDNFVASCAACRENFFNLFCTFTCSPDQSLFVNVTGIGPDRTDKQNLVTELDQLWSDEYGSVFYDSCKDVKFGATNTPAMSFIGGGAKNYTQLLKFLGDKKPLGSPFQINFPRPSEGEFQDMHPVDDKAIPCNTSDPDFRCVCADCNGSCKEPPALQDTEDCRVGAWPCLSFGIVLAYAVCVLLLAAAVAGHVIYRKQIQSRNERLRLLQDAALSDEEEDDEQEIIYQRARKYWPNAVCDKLFSALGRTCARFPGVTIGVSILVVGLLSIGWSSFEIEQNPVRLWVAPTSAAATEKAFFDDEFGPFFRAEQVFLVNDTGPILSYDTLSWLFDLENQVRRIKGRSYGTTLDNVCYKPTGDACVVQSVSGYFDEEGLNKNNWKSKLQGCIRSPVECRPNFKLPLSPDLILGGHQGDPMDSQALVVSWVVKNSKEGSEEVKRAMDFEESLKSLLLTAQMDAKQKGLRLSFNTEISLEQELNKATNTDAKIVVISYIIMFLYASLALGSTTLSARAIMRNPSVALVQSKFMLGVIGILIVLLSVSASVGLFSAAGIKVTLIIAEVIPFLILAVGVDNIFLIVHEFERVNITHPDLPVEDRMARALGRMGPSILLSATMETVAFALGAFVGMPAVRNFAAYAAGAVVVNALLQVTMFVSTLALNQRRVEAGRADCFPCAQVQQPIHLDMLSQAGVNEDGGLSRFIRRTYAPLLLGRKAKVLIITVFMGLLTAGIALLPLVELGLDQRIAIPNDSYLIPYFNDLAAYFDSGPPVYFVTRPLNVTSRPNQLRLCSRFSTCSESSLTNIIDQESRRPDASYIASSAASWVDDFFLWLNPATECCKDPETGRVCFDDRSPPWNPALSGMPQGEEYMHYLKQWLDAPTDNECPLGGRAAYSDAVVPDSKHLTIQASHFRTTHTPLRTQADFINSYASARRIAASISAANDDIDVFPYSSFYIFFDQYATIVQLSLALLGSAIAACFVISSFFLGSLRTGLVVSLTVLMTVVDIAGALALMGVSLNAVTLVNLVICVGISVEFCAHIARAFQFPSSRLLAQYAAPHAIAPSSANGNGLGLNVSNGIAPSQKRDSAPSISQVSRDARAWSAMVQVGGSVFSGITITKLLGVFVLAFTRSKIFEIYYFRVWVALVIFAALHALVFLPVVLSIFGGEGYTASDEGSGGLEEDLRRRRRYRDEFEDEDYDDQY